ncbi:MAG: hypothetical protein MJ123_10620 [Lachnospiraceae bacterium]|nr:hypothetical protein [Lachnospiraceae bacterium]
MMKNNKVSKRLSRGRNLCPVCRKHIFEEKGKYEICPVCGWEDDPLCRKDPTFKGGANELSLEEAREIYFEKEQEEDDCR